MAVDDSVNVQMAANCTVTGGSDSSYVDGPINKYAGTGAAVFPLGKDGVYAPLKTTAVGSGTVIS
ncbi:MAG: hypothetical protein R2850_12925 [Bacteroidia bacterium]